MLFGNLRGPDAAVPTCRAVAEAYVMVADPHSIAAVLTGQSLHLDFLHVWTMVGQYELCYVIKETFCCQFGRTSCMPSSSLLL